MKSIGKIYRFLFVFLSIMVLLLSSPYVAKAEIPYDTFSVNGFERTIFTQPAYKPYGVFAQDIYVTDENGELEYSPLNQPQDMFIDEYDHVFIADTGNNRIIHLDEDGELVRIIALSEDPFNQPSGIFVDTNGEIYVADTGNARVVKLDKEGNFLKEFGRPESKYIDDRFVFEPINLIVDRRGIIFVVSRGTYQGIIQLNQDGEFNGFFGTNITEVSIMDRVRNVFYTEEQLSRQIRLLPSAIRNIDIDQEGRIYTVSRDSKEQIKKINVRGENQWKEFSFGDHINLDFLRMNQSEDQTKPTTDITDVSVDSYGIVTVVDKESAVVAQFDQNGDLLFFWGAPYSTGAPRVGVTGSPVSIDTDSNNRIYILDESANLIQVLEPTKFGSDIQRAYILTQDGLYNESEEYWKEISRQNSLFSPSHAALARAAFYNEDYNKAMDLFKLAGDEEGYSDAFWQIRLNWFQKNFGYFANALIIIGIGSVVVSKLNKRRKKKRKSKKEAKWKKYQLIDHLRHAFYTMKHPIDGFTDIRYRQKGSYASAFIILALVIVVAIMRIYFTSFTFQPVPIGSLNAGGIILTGSVIWFSWVICHYLIGSIRYGEARFKEIFIGSAYSLIPIILLGLPLALLSNIMTLSEGSIYTTFSSLIIVWCAALVFWKVQSLQNYSVGETLTTILITIFSMIMLWVLIFIIVGLSSEVLEFLYTLYQEVTM